MKTLVKVDKNGTKYWVDNTCPKCGGSGYLSEYTHIEAGVCFKCGGTGVGFTEEKEYTPEYAKVLETKRVKREEKKRQELIAKSHENNQEFFKTQGFNQDGKTYVVLGNTYDIKEELKELGAKWSNLIGWHLPYPVDEYPTIEIDVEDVYYKDYTETYRWDNWKSTDEETHSTKISDANNAIVRAESTSEYVEGVGSKVTLDATHKNTFSFDSVYGTTYIHKFVDEAGNILVWKTSKCLDTMNSPLTIKGTVKEHSEFRGEKQTLLTRCKII